ncbi:MAG: VacJ family lipoprotein [Pseudomonadota bacterium]
MSRFAFGFWRCAVVLAIAAVAGCTDPATRGGTYDPYEGGNRGTHAGNIRFDQNIARPLSQGYGNGVAPEVRLVVNNFRSNFEEPSHALNALLQGRIDNAVTSTGRFLINSTVGLLGLFDPASDLGIDQKSTDFGETMFVWGVNEGAYVELPVFGPHTTRHAVGRVVDVALNPLNIFAPSPTGELSATSYVASSLDFRYELTNTIDGILYDSEDSYLTARNLYLQQRRAQLSGGPSDAELTDPFADLE